MGDLIMPVAKRPGYYVEGRFFRDNYHQACARAKFQANEYGRRVEVTYLAPEDCGSVNNAVPYGVANFHPEAARPSKGELLERLPRNWAIHAEVPSVEDTLRRITEDWPSLDEWQDWAKKGQP
jgi:hypothetical protein